MKNIFLFALVILSTVGFGQDTKFTKLFPGDSTDKGVDVVQQSNGDYYILSNTNSDGSGHMDIQLTRTNGLGEIQWSYVYGTSTNDEASRLFPATDGGILIAGYSEGVNSGTGKDGIVMKVTSSGVLSWTRSIIGSDEDEALDVTQTSNGDVYATGYITLDSTVGKNIFVTKITSSGNSVFLRGYGAAGEDIGSAIAVGKNGNIVVAGSTTNDSVNIGTTGDKDFQVIEITTNGTIVNSKNFGTTTEDYATDIAATQDYKYVVLGTTYGGAGGSDVALFQLDTNFAISNTFWYGGIDDDVSGTLVLDAANLVTFSGTTVTGFSPRDVMIVEVDFSSSTGNIIGSGLYGGNLEDGMTTTAITGTNSKGYSLVSSGKSLSPNTTEDVFLLKTAGDFSTSCFDLFDMVQSGNLNLSNNSFDSTVNLGQASNTSLTRNSIGTEDSTECCKLSAQLSTDSSEICFGTSLSLGASPISGYSYSWTSNTNSWTSSNSNPTVTPDASTLYKLVVTSASGECEADSGFLYVEVNALNNYENLTDSFFCDGDSLTLSAASGYVIYNWEVGGSTYTTQNAKFLNTETAYLTLLDNNSCVYRDTIEVEEKSIPVFSLGPDTTICDNLSITFGGPAGMSEYIWNGSSTTSSTFTANTSQNVTLKVVSPFGCEYTDQVQLLTNPSSTFSLGNDTTMCEGSMYTIFGPGALSGFIWNDTASSSANLIISEGGTYHLEAYNSFGCPSYDTITITEDAAPIFSFGADTGICGSINITLTGPGNATYLWFNGTSNQTFNATGPGVYFLEATGSNGCKHSDTINIEQYPEITIDLGPDSTICPLRGESVTLTPGPDFSVYDWSTGASTASITVTQKNTYSVTVTDTNGCMATDEMVLDTSCVNSIAVLGGIEYKLYPNPARSWVEFSTSSSNDIGGDLMLYSMDGKLESVTPIFGLRTPIDLSGFAPGIYFVKLNTETETLTLRFVIQGN